MELKIEHVLVAKVGHCASPPFSPSAALKSTFH